MKHQRLVLWWRTKNLAPPHVIARRLIAAPFVLVLRVLYCFFIWLGWGPFAAKLMWQDTEML